MKISGPSSLTKILRLRLLPSMLQNTCTIWLTSSSLDKRFPNGSSELTHPQPLTSTDINLKTLQRQWHKSETNIKRPELIQEFQQAGRCTITTSPVPEDDALSEDDTSPGAFHNPVHRAAQFAQSQRTWYSQSGHRHSRHPWFSSHGSDPYMAFNEFLAGSRSDFYGPL